MWQVSFFRSYSFVTAIVSCQRHDVPSNLNSISSINLNNLWYVKPEWNIFLIYLFKGLSGEPGLPGQSVPGPRGDPGYSGARGLDGVTGSFGEQGFPGRDGAHGLPGLFKSS